MLTFTPPDLPSVTGHTQVTVLLLPAMRAAMASRQDGVADALWAAMQEGTPEPELFVDLLTLFAARGQLERVRWVLKAAPTVCARAP